MEKNLMILSLGYWFGAHSLGLLLHPYQSMRRVVRQGVFVPLVLLPGVCLGLWWLAGAVVVRVGVLTGLGLGWLAEGLEKIELVKTGMYFGFVWVGLFLIMWQGLLVYLYWRFSKIGKKEES